MLGGSLGFNATATPLPLPKSRVDGGFGNQSGRGERIRTSGLYVPNVALYQAKLHPDGCEKRDSTFVAHCREVSGAPLKQLSRQL